MCPPRPHRHRRGASLEAFPPADAIAASGGPAYPLATPGVRWRFDPDKNWSALVAVFNGDPGEQGTVNTTGTNFRVNDPPLLMGEVQYRHNQGKDDSGLAGIYRLAAGIILENSTTTGTARMDSRLPPP
jgi:hypothetical protein